jgi:hypothetical protein
VVKRHQPASKGKPIKQMSHVMLPNTLIYRFRKAWAVLLLQLLPIAVCAQSAWFPFQPGQGRGQSAFDMRDWLDAPAGKHGFIRGDGNDFMFEDGTKIKFWGVNIASNRPFIPQDEVGQWVDFLAKYGINGVRFHKFTWHAYHGDSSTRLDPAKWERFDYFQAKLREAGIYYG